MSLLLFNLATDAHDPILGFTSNWIASLAKRVDHVHVITMRAGRIDLPDNVTVYSVGKECGYSEPRRAVNFYRALAQVLNQRDIQVCFSHMMPLFTVLASPILKVRGIPVVTWFAHPRLTLTLRLAHHLSARMVTSLVSAYPYKTDKLLVVGQGIDTDLFSPSHDSAPTGDPIILSVGRLSPVKGQLTLIEAAALLRKLFHRPFVVSLIGGAGKPEDRAYIELLNQRAADLSLRGVVEIQNPVPMRELPGYYRRATVHVNLTPTGFGDKVALEAMSCGLPCLSSNEGFRETYGIHADLLIVRQNDPTHLAERLKEVLSLTAEERASIGNYLRARVVAMHSLEGLAGKLVNLFGALTN